MKATPQTIVALLAALTAIPSARSALEDSGFPTLISTGDDVSARNYPRRGDVVGIDEDQIARSRASH